MRNFDRIIYLITNLITGKIYVGQDSYNRPTYLGSGKILSQAKEKYGVENFHKEVLHYCNSSEEADEMEIYWIDKLNARNRSVGYNISKGGKGYTEKALYNLSESGKIFWKNLALDKDEYLKRKKICQNAAIKSALRGSNHPSFGKSSYSLNTEKYGEEKASELENVRREKISKPILKFSKDGKFLNEYSSLSEVSQEIGISLTRISRVCKLNIGDIYKYTSGGFIWKFKNEEDLICLNINTQISA